MLNTTVSHYRIVEHLGGGGMGVVYKAEDTKLGRTVALKFLPPEWSRDPDSRERFLREARAASALEDSRICTIHDIDETEDGQLFIAMAFYEGESLKKRLDRGRLSIGRAVDIAIQVAEGLERAHSAAIIHRDIKPANLMLTGHDEVVIVDFGLAKLAGDFTLTKPGSSLGTPHYMSPEQSRGRAARCANRSVVARGGPLTRCSPESGRLPGRTTPPSPGRSSTTRFLRSVSSVPMRRPTRDDRGQGARQGCRSPLPECERDSRRSSPTQGTDERSSRG